MHPASLPFPYYPLVKLLHFGHANQWLHCLFGLFSGLLGALQPLDFQD